MGRGASKPGQIAGIRALCDDFASCCMFSSDPSLGVASVEGREYKTNSPTALRYVALIIAHKYPADWSRVHGFFAAMGGFVNGRRLLPLEDIEELVLNKEIKYPIATREETSPFALVLD